MTELAGTVACCTAQHSFVKNPYATALQSQQCVKRRIDSPPFHTLGGIPNDSPNPDCHVADGPACRLRRWLQQQFTRVARAAGKIGSASGRERGGEYGWN